MALIKCPECGETISDKATVCIRCGYPIRELGIQPNLSINESKEEKPMENSIAETVPLEGMSLDDEYVEEKQEARQETVQEYSDQEVPEEELCTVDVPKEKYVKWLFILSVIVTWAYNIGSILSNKHGGYISIGFIVNRLLLLLPGIALICNAKEKKLPAKICAIAFAVINIGLTIYYTIVYMGVFLISDYVPLVSIIYLVVYVLQSTEKQEINVWFILGCLIVPLDTVLSLALGWGHFDNMIDRTLASVVMIFSWAYYLVGYCPKRWFNKYEISQSTKKKVVIGRLVALGAGIIAVVVQLVGCIGVSSEEFEDALFSYQLSSFDRVRHAELEKFLLPISEQYYRDNTISIIIACIATVIFVATLVIVHKRKRTVVE